MVLRTGEVMMKHLFPAIVVAAAVVLAALPGQADGMVQAERLLVGKTNIYCVKAPCPWRGISRAADAPAGPATLLWSEESLPRLVASGPDAERIIRAWEGDECLAIEGTMLGPVLTVERIVGTCP